MPWMQEVVYEGTAFLYFIFEPIGYNKDQKYLLFRKKKHFVDGIVLWVYVFKVERC